jgi:GYF domain 2
MSTDEYHPEFADENETWHVSRGDDRSGPLRFSDLVAAIEQQLVSATDFVWHQRWSDWRQIKSVPCLASLVELSGGEHSPLSGSIPSKSVLVESVELKLRPTAYQESQIRRFFRERNYVIVIKLLLIAFTIFILAALIALVFDNSRHGIFYIVIEFTTLFLMGIGATQKSKSESYWSLRFFVLSAIAASLLVVMNLNILPDALDFWQAKRLLTHARASEQIKSLAIDHPSNKYIHLVLISNEAVQQSSASTAQLIKDIEPQGITLDSMRVASTRDQLLENAKDLRAAGARATLARPRYVELLDIELSAIEQAGHTIYSSDPIHLLSGFMGALRKRDDVLRERMGKTFKAIEVFYFAKSDVAEFLAQHWDEYRVTRLSKPSSATIDRATSDRYSKLVAIVRAAQSTMLALERDNVKADADRKMFWKEQVAGLR